MTTPLERLEERRDNGQEAVQQRVGCEELDPENRRGARREGGKQHHENSDQPE